MKKLKVGDKVRIKHYTESTIPDIWARGMLQFCGKLYTIKSFHGGDNMINMSEIPFTFYVTDVELYETYELESELFEI